MKINTAMLVSRTDYFRIQADKVPVSVVLQVWMITLEFTFLEITASRLTINLRYSGPVYNQSRAQRVQAFATLRGLRRKSIA